MIDDHEDEEDAVGFPSSLPPASQQYAYRGMSANGTMTKLAALSIPNDEEDDDEEEEERDLVNGYIGSSENAQKLVWSEPLAPVNDREDAANSQGISFPSTFVMLWNWNFMSLTRCVVSSSSRAFPVRTNTHRLRSELFIFSTTTQRPCSAQCRDLWRVLGQLGRESGLQRPVSRPPAAVLRLGEHPSSLCLYRGTVDWFTGFEH